MTGADDGELVGVPADVGEVVGDGQSALAARAELAEGGRQKTDLSPAAVDVFFVRRQCLASVLLESRLGVEGIDLAGGAVHHQEDDASRLALKVRPCCRLWLGVGGAKVAAEEAVGLQERCQSEPGETSTHFPDRLAPRQPAGKPFRAHRLALREEEPVMWRWPSRSAVPGCAAAPFPDIRDPS